MPDTDTHSVIIIDGCIDHLMGNATNGTLFTLRGAVDALDASLKDHPNPEGHALLESIQMGLCTGIESDVGIDDLVQNWIDACEKLT